jgi:hypothetical protein
LLTVRGVPSDVRGAAEVGMVEPLKVLGVLSGTRGVAASWGGTAGALVALGAASESLGGVFGAAGPLAVRGASGGRAPGVAAGTDGALLVLAAASEKRGAADGGSGAPVEAELGGTGPCEAT